MKVFECGAEAGLACDLPGGQGRWSAEIIELPLREAARVRLLANALLGALEEISFCDQFRVVEYGRPPRVEIDEFAAVLMPADTRDLLFELRMNVGPRILLVTDDIVMMADFVRQYGHARVCNSPALRELL